MLTASNTARNQTFENIKVLEMGPLNLVKVYNKTITRPFQLKKLHFQLERSCKGDL